MLLFGVCGEDKEGRGMSGDLISKQALSKEIKEKIIPDKYGTSNAVLDVMGAVLRVIGEQVTIYDAEKVIQQLEENKEDAIKAIEENSPSEFHMIKIRDLKELFEEYTREQIEIVKSGGIAIGQKGDCE